MMDGSNHLDNGLTFMYDLLCTVLSDDGQLALHQNAAVHRIVVMPSEFLPLRNNIFHCYNLWSAQKIIRQISTIPALRGTDKFYSF